MKRDVKSPPWLLTLLTVVVISTSSLGVESDVSTTQRVSANDKV